MDIVDTADRWALEAQRSAIDGPGLLICENNRPDPASGRRLL
jgi:hypothetical protein